MTRRLQGLGLVLGLLAACAPDAETDPGVDREVVSPDSIVEPGATPAPGGAFLDPDVASRAELAALPGMTPELADSLVARRPFANMLAVDSILGRSLDGTQRDSLFTRLWKPIDLNAASAAELELIPGVGPRMRGEFEEYRPWTDMAQFRREIGKYVDAAEVERLARYVAIR